MLCNKKPYVSQGIIVAAVPGGWRQVVLRRVVSDSYAEPMTNVAKQQKELIELKKKQVEAAEKKNELLGKAKKKPSTINTKIGSVITGPDLDECDANRKFNANATAESKKKRAENQKKKRALHLLAIVDCQDRCASGQSLTKPLRQITLEAAYTIDATKSKTDVTKDIYGPTNSRKNRTHCCRTMSRRNQACLSR